MADLISLISDKFNLNVTPVDYKTGLIVNKGIYKLDNESYFCLIPNYLTSDDIHKIENLPMAMNFEQKTHSNGTEVNRFTYWFGPEYTYGDITHSENLQWHPHVLQQKVKIESDFLVPVNSALINWYQKNHKIPFHQDNEPCLGKSPTIFSLSAGESKTMTIKSVSDDKTISVQLNPGTLLIMFGKFNDNWLHSIPSKCKKSRVNITFRLIQSLSPRSCDNSTILQNLKDEIFQLRNEMTFFKMELQKRDQQIAYLQKQIKTQKSSESNAQRNQVVVLKSEIHANPSIENCTTAINSLIPNDKTKIQQTDIKHVEDYRDKKGPLVIEFTNIKAKISVIKASGRTFLAKHPLSRENIMIRKKALKLKEANIVKKVWEYKGKVFICTMVDPTGRMEATAEILESLIAVHLSSHEDQP